MSGCEGRLIRAHLLPRDLLRRYATRHGFTFEQQRRLEWDPRGWVWACGGATGLGGHHHEFDTMRSLRVPRSKLPASTLELARELGLLWWVDREYGRRRIPLLAERAEPSVTSERAETHAPPAVLKRANGRVTLEQAERADSSDSTGGSERADEHKTTVKRQRVASSKSSVQKERAVIDEPPELPERVETPEAAVREERAEVYEFARADLTSEELERPCVQRRALPHQSDKKVGHCDYREQFHAQRPAVEGRTTLPNAASVESSTTVVGFSTRRGLNSYKRRTAVHAEKLTQKATRAPEK